MRTIMNMNVRDQASRRSLRCVARTGGRPVGERAGGSHHDVAVALPLHESGPLSKGLQTPVHYNFKI